MKKLLLLLLGIVPLAAFSQTVKSSPNLLNSGENIFTAAPGDLFSAPFGATGDCKTDDWRALQFALSQHKAVYLPKPPGGCYLVSKTLTLQAGDYLYGFSANNPNPGDPGAGVVIRLAPNANVPLIRTYTAGTTDGNEYMAIENVVFDGAGPSQTQELQNEALVDFRNTFIGCFLRHILIINSFGPGLYTGDNGGDLRMDTVWITNASTSTYSWIHNPTKPGFGTLNTDQVFVENQSLPKGGRYQPIIYGDPTSYSHAIFINGVQVGVLKTTHCESALTCVDFASVQSLNLLGISATRLGNPTSSDPTNQYLIRMLDTNSYQFEFHEASFDQEGSNLNGSSFPKARVFGLAAGLTTNDWFQTQPGRNLGSAYTHGEFFSQGGAPYLGERPIVGNELWLQKIGQYSPNGVKIWDEVGAPNGTYAYAQRDGSRFRFGFSPGPWDASEENLLQINWYGLNNPANNVEMPERVITGSSGNTDLAGELQLSGAQTASYQFSGFFSTHPECSVTPQFDIGAGNRWWVSYVGSSSFTVNFANAVSGSISYLCVGRQ